MARADRQDSRYNRLIDPHGPDGMQLMECLVRSDIALWSDKRLFARLGAAFQHSVLATGASGPYSLAFG